MAPHTAPAVAFCFSRRVDYGAAQILIHLLYPIPNLIWDLGIYCTLSTLTRTAGYSDVSINPHPQTMNPQSDRAQSRKTAGYRDVSINPRL